MRSGAPSRRAILGAGIATTSFAASPAAAEAWSDAADVVVVGSGACGMAAALVARQRGLSVILLEAEPEIGGHAICSGGNIALGGGTSAQKAAGIEDSADLLFRDLTDWSVISPNGFSDYRFNDRELMRAFADHSVELFEWLLRNGVVFAEGPPDDVAAHSTGNSALRQMHVAAMNWPMVQTGRPVDEAEQATTWTGNGLMRPLEATARKAGVQIQLSTRMTAVIRQEPDGPVDGVVAMRDGHRLRIRARQGVVLATGGSTGNVNFRRMFDPRLTEEYCGVAGEPWSRQDASGEIAGMAVGASLWGLANQTGEFGSNITKPGKIGCRYGYVNLQWQPGSRVWDEVGSLGLKVFDWQNLVLVNMLGRRFFDETAPGFGSNDPGDVTPYRHGDYRNASAEHIRPRNWINAALAGVGDSHNGGGPIWAIFDSAAVEREEWTIAPPHVRPGDGFFHQASTLDDLARQIVMPYQRLPMPPAALVETVTRYNGFVDQGHDTDFDKPAPQYKIIKPPFFAAWAAPVLHDTRAGLRIDGRGRVIDMAGSVIPRLYSGGETAGGFSLHGLERVEIDMNRWIPKSVEF